MAKNYEGESASKRSSSRQSTLLRGELRWESCPQSVEIRIHNLSAGGLMAICSCAPKLGETVSVTIRGIGDVPGQVAWIRAGGIGVTFDVAVDPHLAFQLSNPKPTARFIPPVEKDARRPGLRRARRSGF